MTSVSAAAPATSAAPPSMPFSSSPVVSDSLPVPAASSPFSLSQQVADALYTAAEAKAALLSAQENLSRATDALDRLVEEGLLPEKNLPTVCGFLIYRQEGRVSWQYPPGIKQLEADLKKRRQLAEQLGEATQKRGTPFWTIKASEEGAL